MRVSETKRNVINPHHLVLQLKNVSQASLACHITRARDLKRYARGVRAFDLVRELQHLRVVDADAAADAADTRLFATREHLRMKNG